MKTRSTLPPISTFVKCCEIDSDLSQCSASTRISPDSIATPVKDFRKRSRKNCDQVNVLIQEFKENPEWNKEMIKNLSEKTGLSEAQIYKWNWDYKKKKRGLVRISYDSLLSCRESLAPSRYDSELIVLQRIYKIGFATALTTSSPTRYLFN